MSAREKELLKEIEELKDKNIDLEFKLQGSYYLEEDRRTLNKEVADLKAKNEELKKQNEEYRLEITKLTQQSATLRGHVEVSTIKKQNAVQSILEAVIAERWVATDDEQKEKDHDFRQKFKLPKGEYALAYYSCTDGSHHPGYVYITLQYLVWEHSSMILGGESIIIPIVEIDSINKVRILKFLPGKGTSLEIKMQNGKVYPMNAFFSRKEAIQKIVAQSRILGHSITLLREGAPDENSEIMKVFHQIDRDDKGSILYQDLVVALRTLTLPPTIRNIILVSMTDMDQDGDGHISFGEFQKAVRSGAINWSKKVEALLQKQKTELRQLNEERDALQAEYDKVKKETQAMKDTLDKDPSKKQANAQLSGDIDDILAKLRYVNEMRRILQQIPDVPNVPGVVAQ